MADARDGPLSSADSTFSNYLELFAKALAVGASAAPGIGVLVRWMSFAFRGDVEPPLSIAVAAPLSELAAFGFLVAIVSMTTFAIVYPLVRFFAPGFRILAGFRKDVEAIKAETKELDPEAPARPDIIERVRRLGADIDALEHGRAPTYFSPKLSRLHARILGTRTVFLMPTYLGVAALIVFTQGFPLPLITAAGGLLGAWLLRGPAIQGHLTLVAAWPAIVTILIAGTLSFGLGGRISGVALADFDFKEPAPTPDGMYMELGRTSDRIYVQSCDGEESLAVDPEAIGRIAYRETSRPARPSLWDVLWGAPLRLGLGDLCAHAKR